MVDIMETRDVKYAALLGVAQMATGLQGQQAINAFVASGDLHAAEMYREYAESPVGDDDEATGNASWSAIVKLARKVQDEEGCSLHLAIGRVLGTPEGQALYDEYNRETASAARKVERDAVQQG